MMKISKKQYKEYQSQCEKYKKEMEELLERMEDLTNRLPYKGDKCEDSQKICLISAIHEVYASLSGLDVIDFVEDEDP